MVEQFPLFFVIFEKFDDLCTDVQCERLLDTVYEVFWSKLDYGIGDMEGKVVTAVTTFDSIEEITGMRWCRERKRNVNVVQPQIFASYSTGRGGEELLFLKI